nr:NADH-quinone oxidoreductase subunit L [Actinomycetota bacterium]
MIVAAEAGATHAQLAGWIVGLPLLSAIVLLLVGRRAGRRSGIVASLAIGASFVLGVISFFDLLGAEHGARSATLKLFDWISVGSFDASATLLVDELSIVMVLVVTGVSTLIHIYSIGYMADEARYSRFFGYLNLFAASMLLLVLADNLLLLYVGWEAVGLCSYLLIGFWFER